MFFKLKPEPTILKSESEQNIAVHFMCRHYGLTLFYFAVRILIGHFFLIILSIAAIILGE